MVLAVGAVRTLVPSMEDSLDLGVGGEVLGPRCASLDDRAAGPPWVGFVGTNADWPFFRDILGSTVSGNGISGNALALGAV